MEVKWRDIVGWEGWYQVSNFGSVRRIKAARGAQDGRVLKNRNNINGYQYVNLCRDGICKNTSVHQLVIEAFGSPKPSPDHEVNHKNGIKSDNRIENLEWVTASENMKHAYKVGFHKHPDHNGEKHPGAKLNADKVRMIRKKLSEGVSVKSLAEEFVVAEITIYDAASGRTWKSVK